MTMALAPAQADGLTVPDFVEPVEAWRVARVLEWAKDSSEQHRDIECDWTGEPA